MRAENSENFLNFRRAKHSYYFSIFSFIYFLFYLFFLLLLLVAFFFSFFLVFFFFFLKKSQLGFFNIWKASEAPSEKVQKRTVRSPILHRGKDEPSSRHCCRSCG